MAKGQKTGGRQRGTPNKRTALIIQKATAEGIEPIEVILRLMRSAWEGGDYVRAAEMADIALPYTTPRLAATTITHQDALSKLTLEQLDRLERVLAARVDGSNVVAGNPGAEGAAACGKPH
jgi:hypothetical protein